MIRRGGFVTAVVAVPAVALLVAWLARSRLESEWHTAVVQAFGQDVAAQLPLGLACGRTGLPADMAATCADYTRLAWMEIGALLAGAIAIGLIWFIGLLGRRANRDPYRLAREFARGLRVTVVVLSILVVGEGALAMGSLYYGESLATGYYHPQIIAAVGLLAFVGAIYLLLSLFRVARPAPVRMLGRIVDPVTNTELFRAVEQIAERLEALPPDHVVAGLNPSFFVTQASVATLDGVVNGRTLYLSLPLSRVLSVGELEAVVAHELGHFRGGDTQVSEHFYPVYRGLAFSIATVRAQAGGLGAIVLAPANAVLRYFLQTFATSERELARERELRADSAAAGVTSAAALGSALIKLHALDSLWLDVVQKITAAVARHAPVRDMAVLYVALAQEADVEARVADLDATQIAHPTDTHPPLSVRLDALGTPLNTLRSAAKDVNPSHPGTDLFGSAKDLERSLTDYVNRTETARLRWLEPIGRAPSQDA